MAAPAGQSSQFRTAVRVGNVADKPAKTVSETMRFARRRCHQTVHLWRPELHGLIVDLEGVPTLPKPSALVVGVSEACGDLLDDGGQPIQATLRHVCRSDVPFNAAKFDCPFKLR